MPSSFSGPSPHALPGLRSPTVAAHWHVPRDLVALAHDGDPELAESVMRVVVNGFYRPGFVPDREPRWRESTLSILHMANQARTMQHVRIARHGLDDLRRSIPEVIELAPVDYERVQGAGLYTEFLDNRRWAGYMTDGYRSAAAMLCAREQATGRTSRAAARPT